MVFFLHDEYCIIRASETGTPARSSGYGSKDLKEGMIMKRNVLIISVLAAMMILFGSKSSTTQAGSYSGKETRNSLKGCIVSGCGHTRKGDSMYCSNHKCAVYDCNNRCASNDKYCSTHKGSTAKKKLVNGKEVKDTSGSFSSSSKSKGKSSSSKSSSSKSSSSKSSSSKSGTYKSSSSKSSSSKKKSSSSKKSYGYNSYDEGYEDIWLNDDYDWDRYYRDSDYADGVDDAMEDEDW